jgi:hypothetical protein
MKLAILLALIPAIAIAGKPKDPPKPAPVPVSTAVAHSDAASESHATSASGAWSGSTSSALGGDGGNSTAAGGNSRSNSGGNTMSEVSDYEAKALALGQMRAFAAPPVTDTCLTHSRGWDVTVGGRTGGTQYDKECMDRRHCLALADRFASWGMFTEAARQLVTCGGVVAEPPPDPVPAQPTDVATREYVREVVDRAFTKAVAK